MMLLGRSGACLSRCLAGWHAQIGWVHGFDEICMVHVKVVPQCICIGLGLDWRIRELELIISACLSSQVPSEYPDPTSKAVLLPAQANPLRTTRSSAPLDYHNPNIIHYHNPIHPVVRQYHQAARSSQWYFEEQRHTASSISMLLLCRCCLSITVEHSCSGATLLLLSVSVYVTSPSLVVNLHASIDRTCAPNNTYAHTHTMSEGNKWASFIAGGYVLTNDTRHPQTIIDTRRLCLTMHRVERRAGGAMGALVTCPLEVIKTRLQAHHNRHLIAAGRRGARLGTGIINSIRYMTTILMLCSICY